MISAIVAVDNNWGIGYNGNLLERIPDDMQHFIDLTTNNIIIMGRKTWDYLPKKPLPNRLNIVITSQVSSSGCDLINGEYMKLNLDNAIFQLENNDHDYINYFIIGGGEIYKKLLPFCQKVYITKIYKDHDNVDTYFPNLDKLDNWQVSECSDIKQYKDMSYQFLTYSRIS